MLGILLIDKPLGCTSHDVVNVLRRRLQTRRIGHAGTLDPLASGLLVVAVGAATRFLQYLPLEPKEYIADIQFGRETTTYDGEGEIVREAEPPSDLAGVLAHALPDFQGLIQQLPPMYSAVKIDGQPLYKYARNGKSIEREPRTVHIAAYEILSLEGAHLKARIVCSGGTYVRSLAHDLGQTLGCGAYLTGLVRTNVGRFSLEEATPLESIDAGHLLNLRDALAPMPMLQLDAEQTHDIREGRRLHVPNLAETPFVALLDPKGDVFSIAKPDGATLQPECVIPAEVVPHGTV